MTDRGTSDSPAVDAIKSRLAYLEDNLHRWRALGREFEGQKAMEEQHERLIRELKADAARLGVHL